MLCTIAAREVAALQAGSPSPAAELAADRSRDAGTSDSSDPAGQELATMQHKFNVRRALFVMDALASHWRLVSDEPFFDAGATALLASMRQAIR